MIMKEYDEMLDRIRDTDLEKICADHARNGGTILFSVNAKAWKITPKVYISYLANGGSGFFGNDPNRKGIYVARGSKWDFVPFGSFTMQFI